MGAFTVTDEQIKEWEREKRALEAKLADINEKLNALAVLRRASPSSTPRTKGNGAVIDAMERIITTSPAPITRKELRQRLATEHFSDPGAYFYICINRLKEKQRIRELDNKRLWKL